LFRRSLVQPLPILPRGKMVLLRRTFSRERATPCRNAVGRRAWLGWSAACLLSCQRPARPSQGVLSAPTDKTTLGPGDRFRLQIVGEKDLPTEYQVAADGTVTLPYIQNVAVAGLEPNEVAALVRERLVAS